MDLLTPTQTRPHSSPRCSSLTTALSTVPLIMFVSGEAGDVLADTTGG